MEESLWGRQKGSKRWTTCFRCCAFPWWALHLPFLRTRPSSLTGNRALSVSLESRWSKQDRFKDYVTLRSCHPRRLLFLFKGLRVCGCYRITRGNETSPIKKPFKILQSAGGRDRFRLWGSSLATCSRGGPAGSCQSLEGGTFWKF